MIENQTASLHPDAHDRIDADNSNDGASGDYPSTWTVYSSQDGVNFSPTPDFTGSGTPNNNANNQTIINFPTQENVQPIRIQVVTQVGTSNSSHWWSVDEFEPACSLQ